MTYGIPLATTLYKFHVGGTVAGVILAVLVPMVPLTVFILLPFFEQISLNLEWSASMLGANRLQIFRRILLPLMVPGILTAGLLVLVNTISNFELALLMAGGGSQTLVVALRFVRPTQMVFKLDRS
jgi:putative spermidine/putrescine transport system permease protein